MVCDNARFEGQFSVQGLGESLIRHTEGEGMPRMWIVYGLMSAAFAAISSILDKTGVNSINSNFATAIRTSTVVIMAWFIVYSTGMQYEGAKMDGKGWVVLLISGVLTGLSWLSYFKAMSLAEVSKVVPLNRISVIMTILLASVFLKETLTLKTVVGGAFMIVGTLLMVL